MQPFNLSKEIPVLESLSKTRTKCQNMKKEPALKRVSNASLEKKKK